MSRMTLTHAKRRNRGITLRGSDERSNPAAHPRRTHLDVSAPNRAADDACIGGSAGAASGLGAVRVGLAGQFGSFGHSIAVRVAVLVNDRVPSWSRTSLDATKTARRRLVARCGGAFDGCRIAHVGFIASPAGDSSNSFTTCAWVTGESVRDSSRPWWAYFKRL
jgi:hypothetical protein